MAQLLDSRVNGPEPLSPVEVLDQAFTLLRRAGAQRCVRGIAASLPLAAALISLYALERVLDARPSLLLFAVLCVLAYCARYRVLSGVARELVLLLEPESQSLPPASSLLAGLQTALVVGIGSCAWAGCLIVAEQGSFFGLLACLPFLCVRGAIAPSLLARTACAPEGGMAALRRAVADTRELRQLFVRVELFALIGLLLLFGNLYALLATLLLVASSMIGVDVGFVSALIAPDNELVLLLLLGLATLLLEPLRAAISAIAFHNAREQTEGADLRAAIAALPSTPRRERARPQPTAAGRGLVGLLLLSCVFQAPVRADEARRAWPADLPREAGAVDELARETSQAILARGEFLPSASDSERGAIQAWLDRRLRERERELSDHDLSMPARFELRIPPAVVVLVSLLVLLGVSVWLVRGLRRARIEANAARLRASIAPTQADCLAQAAQFAQEGAYAQAVRSLFAACLQALARDKRAGFSWAASQTNGQLLTQLAPGQLQAAFAPLSAVFERCCYGRQPLSRADYETANELAGRILQLTSSAERAR